MLLECVIVQKLYQWLFYGLVLLMHTTILSLNLPNMGPSPIPETPYLSKQENYPLFLDNQIVDNQVFDSQLLSLRSIETLNFLPHNLPHLPYPISRRGARGGKLSLKHVPGSGKREIKKYTKPILLDALELHRNLFTWDTLKIAGVLFPFYFGTRLIDEKLQNCFYDRHHHKNIHYIPKPCHSIAQCSIAIPIVLLGSQAFFGSTEEMRETSKIFLLGLPFVFWTKTLIKKIHFEANMRPWHESFDRYQRSCGGFPSGHMAEATYTALVYGLRFGPRFAVPLGALALGIGATFVVCNRHYISQIVAGAGLGAVYAFAANKLIDSKKSKNLKLGFKFDHGKPALSINYRF